jgi:hypothetical protein
MGMLYLGGVEGWQGVTLLMSKASPQAGGIRGQDTPASSFCPAASPFRLHSLGSQIPAAQ